jgi:hypothetical protein
MLQSKNLVFINAKIMVFVIMVHALVIQDIMVEIVALNQTTCS